MTYEKVCTYLTHKGINDFSKFSLLCEGKHIKIEFWAYEIPKPSETDLTAITEEDIALTFYAEKRRAVYPEIGEQLDAIMKWVATENEITVPSELKSIAMKCMSVKAQFPKKKEV